MYQGPSLKYFKFSCVILASLIVLSIFVQTMIICPPLSQNDKAELDIKALETAILLYHKDNNRLPENLGNLTKDSIPYIKRLPKDPWVNEYQYNIVAENSFLLWSKGSILSGKPLVLSAYKYDGNNFIKVPLNESEFGT